MVALPGEALLELITASTILPVVIYGTTVALYLAVRRRLDRKEGAFDLGASSCPSRSSRWSGLAGRGDGCSGDPPPGAALVSVLIVLGLMLVGGLSFVGMLMFDRKSLDTEPDAEAIFTH